MCAQFTIKSNIRQLEQKYGLAPLADNDEPIDLRVVPYQEAPIIVLRDGIKMMQTMNYSMIPSWSKERKCKFATHNARLDSIEQKPTWKRPFFYQHCLVPMTHFIEPIYEHELAGKMVAFRSKHGDYLTAAGIYDQWMDKKTGEVIDSFAIITSDPPDFVYRTGHDRCPLFLEEDAAEEWLRIKSENPAELKQLLLEGRKDVEFDTQVDRPLKPGWEKRIKQKV